MQKEQSLSAGSRETLLQTFKQALRNKDFTLSAELAIDAGSDRAAIVKQAKVLALSVDAIQVSDNSAVQSHLSPIATSSILLDIDIDPVLHLNCRDRNRLALRADLLGAAALGVSSVLLMRGQDLPANARPRIKTVYDWGTRKLIACASSLEKADFMIGSIATAFKPDRDWEPAQLTTKVNAGVKFVQTQLCFDADILRHYMARLVAGKITQRANVLVSLAAIPSAEVAHWLGKNLRGAVVPAKVVKRLKEAADPQQEGIAICAELLAEAAQIPGVSGANLVCMGDPAAVAESVRQSGVRP